MRARDPVLLGVTAKVGGHCIYACRLYLSAGAEQDRLTLQYYGELQRLRLRVALPPMVIPINPVRSDTL